MRSRGYVRPRQGRLFAGVLVGLARKWDMGVWNLRLLFILSFLLPGPQFVAYFILWAAMPSEARR
jgi:phage shock protein PspC (stress-responsive transcriptional regulator)